MPGGEEQVVSVDNGSDDGGGNGVRRRLVPKLSWNQGMAIVVNRISFDGNP